MRYSIIIIFILLICQTAFSMGSVNLMGKLIKIDEKTVEIESGQKVYKISRSKLGKEQNLLLIQTSKKSLISLVVYFDGIESVRHK